MRAILQAFLVLLVFVGVVSANGAYARATPCDHGGRSVVAMHDAAIPIQAHHAKAVGTSHKSSHHQHPGTNCNDAVCCAGALTVASPAVPMLPERVAAAEDIPTFASVRLTTRAVAPPHGPPRLTI